jgi:hypothetical protein
VHYFNEQARISTSILKISVNKQVIIIYLAPNLKSSVEDLQLFQQNLTVCEDSRQHKKKE